MSARSAALAAFIQAAPPGEIDNVSSSVKIITEDDSLSGLDGAFKKYNEEQLTTVILPGGSQTVLVSEYNSLSDGQYYDVQASSSFSFDHKTRKASNTKSHVLESKHEDIIKSILKSVSSHANEHYPSSTVGVFPTDNDSKIAILLVASKYSPANFWNGRWRASYLFDPAASSLSGAIKVDVHYYEDGNVRLLTKKDVEASLSASATGTEVVKAIAAAERKYQEELNRGFMNLSEGAFKSLRRQLPVTRQKIEWSKVTSYRIGQDIGGGRLKQ